MRPASSRAPPRAPPAPLPQPHWGWHCTLGSGRADLVQGQQSPDQWSPHGNQPFLRGISLPNSFIILVRSGTPWLRPGRLSTRLRPGAVSTGEGRRWRPQPFLLFFSTSPIPAALREGEGRAKRRMKPLLVSGHLPAWHPNSDFFYRARRPHRSDRVAGRAPE